MLKALLSDNIVKTIYFYLIIYNGLKNFKGQSSITITKVEESTVDSFEPIEINYQQTAKQANISYLKYIY